MDSVFSDQIHFLQVPRSTVQLPRLEWRHAHELSVDPVHMPFLLPCPHVWMAITPTPFLSPSMAVSGFTGGILASSHLLTVTVLGLTGFLPRQPSGHSSGCLSPRAYHSSAPQKPLILPPFSSVCRHPPTHDLASTPTLPQRRSGAHH